MIGGVWFLLAGVLVAGELLTGTLYLLVLALGANAGGLAARFGFAVPGQFVVAAVIAALGAVFLKRWRTKHSSGEMAPSSNKDVILDVGEQVVVRESDAKSGESQGWVTYRGALWEARTEDGLALAEGRYVISSVEGACLVLSKRQVAGSKHEPAARGAA